MIPPKDKSTDSGEAQHPHRGEQHPPRAPAKDTTKEATRRGKAGRRARARHHRRPTHRATQRKRKRPTKPPTTSNQDGRKARRRNGGKPQPHAQRAQDQPTRGHATPPARTNRRRATTRNNEPRQPPRGTGKDRKSHNQPRDKDTKKTTPNRTPQPPKKPPQAPKKPPQPQKRRHKKGAKPHPKRRRPGTQAPPPGHPLYFEMRDPHDKNRAGTRKTEQARPRAGGALGEALSLG